MSLNFTTSSAATASATSNGITASGTINLGDLILLISEVTDGSGSATITPPAGFTLGSALSPAIPNKNVGSNGSDTFNLSVKIAAAGDVGSPTYTSNTTVSGYWKQQLRVYSGRANGSIAAAFGNSAVTADITVAAAIPVTYPMTGVTAIAGDDIVAVVYGATGLGQSGITSYSLAISGFSNLLASYYITYGNNGLITSLDYVNNPGGATGSLSSVLSKVGGSGNTEYVGGFVISLPQSGGGGTVPAPMYHRKNVLYFI